MNTPETREDLIAMGWEYLGDGRCTNCGKVLQWWKNTNGNRVPMILIDDGEELLRKPHFGCKRAA